MPRPLKRGILGASTIIHRGLILGIKELEIRIILSKDIDKYGFMCGSNIYESDVIKNFI